MEALAARNRVRQGRWVVGYRVSMNVSRSHMSSISQMHAGQRAVFLVPNATPQERIIKVALRIRTVECGRQRKADLNRPTMHTGSTKRLGWGPAGGVTAPSLAEDANCYGADPELSQSFVGPPMPSISKS